MGIEIQILDWIQGLRTPAGDVFMPVITSLGNVGIIWILLAVLLLIIPKTRKTGAVLAIALVLDVVLCNGIIKNLAARMRPYDRNPVVELLIHKPIDYSFPSGHTAASFAAVSALYFAGEKHMWKPVLVLAVLIAFSRLYLYVHYPTDVIGGAVLGILCGYLADKIAGYNMMRAGR
ncbi:MAG: phosphatase PAP2 family protein [Dorea sp.]|nr:phosphatase PAP2 family protein [Dorea sp.]